jgi:hypothetical protein
MLTTAGTLSHRLSGRIQPISRRQAATVSPPAPASSAPPGDRTEE